MKVDRRERDDLCLQPMLESSWILVICICLVSVTRCNLNENHLIFRIDLNMRHISTICLSIDYNGSLYRLWRNLCVRHQQTFSHMFCIYRSEMAVHQPGDPDLHRVLWYPSRDGGPHLPHPVHGARQARNLRTLGESEKWSAEWIDSVFEAAVHTLYYFHLWWNIRNNESSSVSRIWSLKQHRCMMQTFFSFFLLQLAKNVGNSSFNEIMEGNLSSPSPKPTPSSDMWVLWGETRFV